MRELVAECLDAQRREELAAQAEAQADETTLLPRIPGRREAARTFFDRPSGPLPLVS